MNQNLENKINEMWELHQILWNSQTTKENVAFTFAQLLEEAGECRGAFRNWMGRQYRPERQGSLDHVIEELGDCYNVLIALTFMAGSTPDECIDKAMQKMLTFKKRKDDKHFENNTKISAT